MKKSVAIIGAGLSGITVASKIKDKFEVQVFEKARGVGGRMSTRKDPPLFLITERNFLKLNQNVLNIFFPSYLLKKLLDVGNSN